MFVKIGVDPSRHRGIISGDDSPGAGLECLVGGMERNNSWDWEKREIGHVVATQAQQAFNKMITRVLVMFE